MKRPSSAMKQRRSIITKEFLTGLVAIILGGYNLLPYFGVNLPHYEPPKIIANVVLVLAGVFLWFAAYKLWRYKWHSSRIF